jgi:hypothetical protein
MTFTSEILNQLTSSQSDVSTLPSIPFSLSDHERTELDTSTSNRKRTIRPIPLLVRSPNASVYTVEGRSKLLSSIGVPAHQHNHCTTKILIVSFGGQSFRRPHSRVSSRAGSSLDLTDITNKMHLRFGLNSHSPLSGGPHRLNPLANSDLDENADTNVIGSPPSRLSALPSRSPEPVPSPDYPPPAAAPGSSRPGMMRLASASHIFIPGAPPAVKTPATPTMPSLPTFGSVIPASPVPTPISEEDPSWGSQSPFDNEAMAGGVGEDAEEEPALLPDESWIAIVCGVPKEWGREHGEELPDGFYVAPKDVYMPGESR